MIHTPTQTKKIKAIIRENLQSGPQVCADKLNHGNFAAPTPLLQEWTADQIIPYLYSRDIPKPKEPKPVVYTDRFSFCVTSEMCLEVGKKGSVSKFIRAAIDEKLARDAT